MAATMVLFVTPGVCKCVNRIIYVEGSVLGPITDGLKVIVVVTPDPNWEPQPDIEVKDGKFAGEVFFPTPQSALVAIGPSGKIWPRLARRCRLALKRELPQTCCTECGAAGYNATVANGRCNKIIGEGRCHGIKQRATNITDGEECASSRAAGVRRNKICSLCRGVGFLFIGKI